MFLKRVTAVVGVVSAGLIALAPTAYAATTLHLYDPVYVNYESGRWSEELYVQITWYGCKTNNGVAGTPNAFTAQIWEDISLEPDESYDSKRFTACFAGDRSNGEWTDLPAGKKQYYWQLMEIQDTTLDYKWLTVDHYIRDSTKAD